VSYVVGVDLGTTFTAAAVWRDGFAQIASLGSRGAAIPSVVLLRGDEEILTGEAAERRAVSEPDRVAREFKRRLGDSTPILLAGTPYSAEALMSRLLRWVIEEVTTREGQPPDAITVSHPANWGAYKIDLLQQAIRIADVGAPVTLITEPEAAAISYATEQRLAVGQVVAVFDLGGGTFDAAVLRRTADGFEILGDPEGIERLGGIDFDAAVFAHVARTVGDSLTELDENDLAAQKAVARLRTDCTQAKEALSADTDTSIPVLLPNLQTEVRLTRAEFEAIVRPSLVDAIEALRRALRNAGVQPDDVAAVLLVGGSSRIPLVAQLVGAELGRPVAVDTHPKHAIAIGASYAAATAEGATSDTAVTETPPTPATADSAEPTAPITTVPVQPAPARSDAPPTISAPAVTAPATMSMPAVAADAAGGPGGPTTGDELPEIPPDPPSSPPGMPGSDGGGGWRRPGVLIGGAILLVLLIGGAIVFARGGDDDPAAADTTETAGDNIAGDNTVGDTVEGDTVEGDTVADTTESTTSTTSTTTTTTIPPDEDCTEAMQLDRWVCLESVRTDGSTVTVGYRAEFGGETPSFVDGIHLHVFGNDLDPINAGSNGPAPGTWEVVDSVGEFSLPLDNVIFAGSPEKICAVVGDARGELVGGQPHGYYDANGGNCLPLA
jgi:molecular chaperone DnaK